MNKFPHDSYSHPEYYNRPNRRFHILGVVVPAVLITVAAGAVIFAATGNADSHPAVIIPCSPQLCPRPTSSSATTGAKKAGQALKQSATKIATQGSEANDSDTATSAADSTASVTPVPGNTLVASITASPTSLKSLAPSPDPSDVPSPTQSAAASPSSSAPPSPNPSPNPSVAPSPGSSASPASSANNSLSVPVSSA